MTTRDCPSKWIIPLGSRPTLFCRTALRLLALLSLAIQPIRTQPAGRPGLYVEVLEDTSFVTCYKEPAGSRLARSDILVSPDGRFRAYAQVEAMLIKRGRTECVNTSRLFVKSPESDTYKLVFLQEPMRWELGNGMKVVDWSPGGRQLLVELEWWQYGSDAGGKTVLIYNADYGYFTQPALGQVFSKTGKPCALRLDDVAGFSSHGKVVLKVGPWFEDEGTIDQDSCVQKEGFWLLDPARDTVEALPDDYRARRSGKLEKHRDKK